MSLGVGSCFDLLQPVLHSRNTVNMALGGSRGAEPPASTAGAHDCAKGPKAPAQRPGTGPAIERRVAFASARAEIWKGLLYTRWSEGWPEEGLADTDIDIHRPRSPDPTPSRQSPRPAPGGIPTSGRDLRQRPAHRCHHMARFLPSGHATLPLHPHRATRRPTKRPGADPATR